MRASLWSFSRKDSGISISGAVELEELEDELELLLDDDELLDELELLLDELVLISLCMAKIRPVVR